MPDIFVPVDTARYTDYHRNLVARGVVIRSTTGYIENHRRERNNATRTSTPSTATSDR